MQNNKFSTQSNNFSTKKNFSNEHRPFIMDKRVECRHFVEMNIFNLDLDIDSEFFDLLHLREINSRLLLRPDSVEAWHNFVLKWAVSIYTSVHRWFKRVTFCQTMSLWLRWPRRSMTFKYGLNRRFCRDCSLWKVKSSLSEERTTMESFCSRPDKTCVSLYLESRIGDDIWM